MVNRETLYHDVLSMYQEGSMALEHPLFIKYEGENAVDDGGVQRDMFLHFGLMRTLIFLRVPKP